MLQFLWKKIKKPQILFLGIFILGAINRIYFLTLNPSFWLDEATVWNISREPVIKLIKGEYWDFPSHPFFVYLLVKFLSFFSLKEWWIRFPYTISSISTTLTIFSLGKEIFSKKRIALLASFLFAYSSYSVKFSTEAKFYAIVFFFETLSLFFFFRIIRSPNKKNFFFFIFLSFLAFITDYSFLWLFSLYWLYLFFFYQRKLKEMILFPTSHQTILFFSLCSTLFLFSPWLIKFIQSLDDAFNIRSYIPRPNFQILVDTFSKYLFFHNNAFLFYPFHFFSLGRFPFPNFINFLLLVIFAILLFICPIKWKKYLDIRIFLLYLIIFFPPISSFLISQYLGPIFIHYNLMIVQLGIILILAFFIYFFRRIGIILLILYVISNTLSLKILFNQRNIQNGRIIYQFLSAKNLGNQSAIIFFPGFQAQIIEYYEVLNSNKPKYQKIKVSHEIINQNSYRESLLSEIKKYHYVCSLIDNNLSTHYFSQKILKHLTTYFLLDSEVSDWTGFDVRCFQSKKN